MGHEQMKAKKRPKYIGGMKRKHILNSWDEILLWELGENVWHVIGKIAKAYNFVVDFIILSSLIGVHTKKLWDS